MNPQICSTGSGLARRHLQEAVPSRRGNVPPRKAVVLPGHAGWVQREETGRVSGPSHSNARRISPSPEAMRTNNPTDEPTRLAWEDPRTTYR